MQDNMNRHTVIHDLSSEYAISGTTQIKEAQYANDVNLKKKIYI